MPTNPDDFYSDIFDQQDRDSQSVLRQSMYVGAQSEPDAAASDLKIAESTGVPAQVVSRNKERVKQVNNVDKIDYGYLIDHNPKVSDWIKDTKNASVSHDDIDNLMEHENVVKKYNVFDSFWKSLNSGAAAGNAMIARAPAAMVDAVLLPGNLWLKAFGQSDKQVRSPEWLRNNDVANFYDAQQEAWSVPELDRSIVEQVKQGDFAGAGKTLFSQLVANAPQQAVIIASAMTGRPVMGLGYAGVTAASGANKTAQESDVDPASATIDAVTQGTIEAAFERLGTFGVFKKWESAIAKAVGKQSAKQVIKEFGKTMAYSTMAEGNEELWTQAGQDFTDYITGVNPDGLKGILQRSIDAGIVGAASGGAMTAPAATASGINLGRQMRQAEQTKDFYLSLGNTVESSKLRERLPEKHRQYVESLVKDSPIESIYVPVDVWDMFMQSKNVDPAVVANEVGINQEYDNAKDTGTDIKIPLATWANKVVGTEYYQGLADDIKFDPQGQTVNEVKVEQETIKAEVEAANAAAKPVEQAQVDSSQVVADKVAEQLKSTGQFSDKDVKHLSSLWGSFAKSFGERIGIDPLEFFNQNPLSVSTQEINADSKDQTLEQSKQKYRVAFEIDGKVYEGNPGEIHAQLIDRLPKDVQKKYFDDEENQGFMSGFVDDSGEFQTRGDIQMRTGKVPNVEIINDYFIKQGGINDTTAPQVPEQGQAGKAEEVFEQRAEATSVVSYVKDGKKYYTKLTPKELEFLKDEVRNIPQGKGGESQIHLDANTESLKRQGVEISRGEFIRGHSQAKGIFKSVMFQNRSQDIGNLTNEIKKYKSFKEFSKDYELLYHGGSENIIGDKLFNNARVSGEVNKENLGTGSDYGGIFFTPERSFAETFSSHSPSGKGKVHTFLVNKSNIFDPENTRHQRKLNEFIGKYYIDQDGEKVEFTKQMYDFIFPKFDDGKRYMDWATFDGNILEAIGFNGARVIENYDNDEGHLWTTVLFRGGENSPHWLIPEGSTIEDIYNDAINNKLFQNQENPLGAIIFGKQGGFDMRLLKDMNYSTFLHETGHAFLEILRRNSAHAEIKEMSDAVLKWFGVESWDKVDRKHHEQWAQGFEKYLFEGKAPSQPLRNAFARFRVWLISVYKTMTNIGVELSDEIRGVMDRMLATDEEIALAEMQHGTLGMIQNPIEILGEEKGQRYLDAIMESKQEAEATMQLKLMEEYQRERKSWWIDEYKKVREEVAKEVNVRREQMALSILQKGEMPDGTPVRDDLVGLKINTKDLIQHYAAKHDENVIPTDYSGMESEFNVEMLQSSINDILEFREQVGKIKKYADDYLKEELDKLPKRYLTSNKFAKTLDEVASDLGFESDQALLNKIIYNEESYIKLKDELISAKKELRSIQKSNRLDKYASIKESMRSLPHGITNKNGISVDVVAQLFGYSSPDEFLDVMSRTKNRNELIKEISTQKMNDTYGEIYGDKQEMAEQANQAIHNDKREQVLRMELDYLASQHKPVMKDLIRTVSARIPSKQDIKKYAGEIIGRTPLREISPYRFRLAERRAAKEAGALFAQGKFEEALNAKRRELLNYELYRESNEAQENVKKSLKNFKNIFKSDDKLSKSRDLDYVNAARSILGLYGIGNSEDDPYNHINKTKAYEPEVYETLVALVDAASENYGNYESITYDQFVNMKQAVEAIWDISRRSRQIQINDQKVELDDVRQHLIDRIGELIKPSDKQKYTKSASDNDKFVRALMGARAQARRVESWVDVMDGGNSKGWFTQAIWNPVIEGTQAFRIKNREYTQKFLDIIKPLEKTLIKNDIVSHELGHIFRSKAELLGAMLHTGNESNLSKLLRGRGWGMYSEDGTLDRSRWDAFILRMQEQGILTKADYDFIQSIWDLFEELKPAAQKAHKEMYGFYFNEITKDEFMTPWGKYRGGYAPAIVDPFISEDAAIRQEKEQSENANNSYMFPTTGRGFTKQRVERYAAPLAIDLRLVPQHINKVLRFTHIEPRVKDVGRLIRNPEFREVLRDLDPTVGQNMLAPWLQRAAQQMVEMPDRGPAGWKLWRELRTRSGLNIMAGNVINTLQQFTGLSIAKVKVKPQYLRNSLWNYMHNPKQVASDVVEQSDFMKTRTTTHIIEVQRNIDELLLNQNNYEKAIEYARKHGYFLQVGTQNIVDMVVWPAAYDQSVAQGNEHNQAVRDADAAVRLTQGDFSPENVSNIEAGTAFFRAFTMFYSYFNMQANLLGTEFSKVARDLGLKRGAGRMFYVYLFGFMIPAVVSELIMKSLSGEDWDKDDDGYMDDVLAMFFGAQFRTATAMLPFVGQALNVAVNKFNKKWYDDDIRTSPAITMIESAVSSPHSVYKALFDDGSKRSAIRDVLSLIGLLTGAPVMPLSKPLGYLSDVSEGNVFPEDNLDFTRGLITGRSGK